MITPDTTIRTLWVWTDVEREHADLLVGGSTVAMVWWRRSDDVWCWYEVVTDADEVHVAKTAAAAKREAKAAALKAAERIVAALKAGAR